MTLDERRRMAERLLLEDPARSDRSLVSLCGMHRLTIGRIRRGLVEAGRIAAVPRVGRDGKTYVAVPQRAVGPARVHGPARVRRLRDRMESLLAALRAPETAAEFGASALGTRDGMGRLALEIAAAVQRLRGRAGERRSA